MEPELDVLARVRTAAQRKVLFLPHAQSCLLSGVGIDGRPLHVVCAPTEEYLAVITAYVPDQGAWSDGFRKRVKA